MRCTCYGKMRRQKKGLRGRLSYYETRGHIRDCEDRREVELYGSTRLVLVLLSLILLQITQQLKEKVVNNKKVMKIS